MFKEAVKKEKPLIVLGVPNAYTAMMAERLGFFALYLSGASVANNCYGVADEGITTLSDVLIEVRRIVKAVKLPLLVDVDTGFEDPQKTVEKMEEAGASAIHIEDQLPKKLCGHLPGKKLVSKEEMCARIKAAVKGRKNQDFVIMARTDALAVEGVEKTLERSLAYKEAGADMLFLEAVEELTLYSQFQKRLAIPILANMTEFGKTPLVPAAKLEGVDMALYPLTLSRCMNFAAKEAIETVRADGSQKVLIPKMQTRAELYSFLN